MKLIRGRSVALLLVGMFLSGPVEVGAENPGQVNVVAAPGVEASRGAALPAPGLTKAVGASRPEEKAAVVPDPVVAAGTQPAKSQLAQADCLVKAGKRHRQASPRRCEPQSLTYARQRSGIMTCRNGYENGPMTWFAAEKKAGRTSAEPAAGSVLILKGQGHGMPTGHVAYVEEVLPETATTYRLLFSHTNYDRRCSLETDIEAIYDRAAMTLDVRNGAWRVWGHGLKVAGFIHGVIGEKAAAHDTVSDLTN